MKQKIVVCGAGTMGRSITQVSAQHQYEVVLYDVNVSTIQQAQAYIESDLSKLVSKGKLAAGENDIILSRIHFTNVIEECIGDIIIEAVVEIVDVKVELFKTLQSINASSTILASNTSSISIASIANELDHPQQVAGLHFFNPATIMKLVEVVQTDTTDPLVIQQLIDFTHSLKKTPVL